MGFHVGYQEVLDKVGELAPLLVVVVCVILERSARQRGQQRQRRFISSPYYYQLVHDFEDLVQDLSPSAEYMKEGKAVANRIFQKLTRESGKHGLKIGKALIAGSFGKGTGITHKGVGGEVSVPDLDLVVFVNDEVPPFVNVFRKFQKILEKMPEIQYVYVRRFSVEMSVATPTQGNIKVDLLAAPNRVKNVASWGDQNVGDVEAQLTLLDLEGAEDEYDMLQKSKLLSSSFAVKTVETIAEYVKDPFMLSVVQLAKFWNSGVRIPSRLAPAKSCMIELIALHCQQRRGRRHRRRFRKEERCPVSGFRRFLEMMVNLPTLDISLRQGGDNVAEGLGSVNYTLPVVRDPVNPINNLAEGLHPMVIRELVTQAQRTLQVLERFKRRAHYYCVDDALREIFSHKD